MPGLERRDGVAGACVTAAVDEQHWYLVVLNLNGSDLGPGPWSWIPARLRRWLPFLPGVPVTQTLASSVTVIDLSHV